MAKQTINPGVAPTGAGGDTFRSGSAKLQANDNELYTQLGATAQGVLPAALPLSKGGTGATSAAAARTNLGLGTAATATLTTSTKDITTGRVAKVGDFGLGMFTSEIPDTSKGEDWSTIPTGFYGSTSFPTTGKTAMGDNQGAVMSVACDGFYTSFRGLLHFVNKSTGYTKILVSQSWYTSGTRYINELLSTGNTTFDSNGFVKKASPIVSLYADHIELNDGAKDQGVTFEKLGVGDYLIKGSTGFAQESWYIEQPKDANGNIYHAVIYDTLENGDISVKTYDYMLNNKGRIVADTETPLDIPENRWIDIRLQELPQPEIEVTDDSEQ